jgi:hypothetical protein
MATRVDREASLILDAYSAPAGVGLVPLPDAPVHVLGSKFTPGGDPVDGTLGLADLLVERFECDAHFTSYTSPELARLVKGIPHPQIRFDLAVLDLDFDDHQSRPTLGDFAALIRIAHLLDEVPNVVYETRGGARFIYVIEPITDADQFERHFHALLTRVAAPIARSRSPYQVDLAAKDWTRLYRCPLVVRDRVEEFDRQVRVMHPGRLCLTSFRVRRPKPRVVYSGHERYAGDDPRLELLIRGLKVGSRNTCLYKAAAYVLSRYAPADAESLLVRIGVDAASAGLGEREVVSTIQSARNRVGRPLAKAGV